MAAFDASLILEINKEMLTVQELIPEPSSIYAQSSFFKTADHLVKLVTN